MAEVKFIWTEEMVGARVGVYPPEEGNRAKACSERHWSPVESLPLERIREIQWERFQNLIRFAYERSAFYRRRWDEAGVRPEDIRTWDDIRHIPIVDKYDFGRDQAEHPPYGTAYTSPPNTQLKYWQTSGTTAKPRLWCETKEDWENGIFLYARSLYGHGVRPGWRAFFGFAYPPFIGFWLAHYAAEAMGCQMVPKGPVRTVAWLRLMENLAAEGVDSFLVATPTFALRHIEVAQQEGIDLRKLNIRIVSMAGEPGATIPSTKRYIEDAFGAKAHDILGCVECSGPILFTCAEQAELEEPSDHLNMDYFLVELVDPDTRQPVDGDTGAVVITALQRFGQPAIRFFLGDIMTIKYDRCACGRTLPLVTGGVKARSDDMIIVKGVNVYPSLVENSIHSIEGLGTEWRVKQRLTSATVLVEAEPGVPKERYPELAKRLQDDIKEKTTVTLDVEVLDPGTLPREEGKTKRIIREP